MISRREVGELVGDREEQVVRRRLLHDLAVEIGAQRVRRRVELGGRHELGPERQEAVLPLHAQHRAAVGVAEVVQADVVRAGVAGDVVERLVDSGTPFIRRPIDDRKLALVVEEPAAARAAGSTPRCPFSADGGFMKYDGALGIRARYSSTAAAVAQVDGEDLARRDRARGRRLGLGDARPSVEHHELAPSSRPQQRFAVELDADVAAQR